MQSRRRQMKIDRTPEEKDRLKAIHNSLGKKVLVQLVDLPKNSTRKNKPTV